MSADAAGTGDTDHEHGDGDGDEEAPEHERTIGAPHPEWSSPRPRPTITSPDARARAPRPDRRQRPWSAPRPRRPAAVGARSAPGGGAGVDGARRRPGRGQPAGPHGRDRRGLRSPGRRRRTLDRARLRHLRRSTGGRRARPTCGARGGPTRTSFPVGESPWPRSACGSGRPATTCSTRPATAT